MAIAYDTVAIPSAALYTATFSWTHTPVGTPKGVAVIVVQEGSTDQVSGVTYGGVTMTRVRRDVRTVTEPGCVYIYFLGSSIPTGAQAVQVTLSGASDTNAVSLTVTAATANTAVDIDNGLNAGIIINPSLSISPTVAAEIFYGIFSGLAAPVTTVQTGSTHVAGKDYGTDSAMWARKSVSAGATTIGYTAASDDVCHSALAIKESTAVTHYGVATLSGIGALAGIGALIKYGLAILAGVGSLASIGALTAIGKAILSGVGTLTSAGVRIFTGKATLTGVGSLAAAGTTGVTHYGIAILAGSGTIIAIGRVIFIGKVTLSGIGNVITSAVAILVDKATLAGVGLLNCIGYVESIDYGQITFTGTGALVVAGSIVEGGHSARLTKIEKGIKLTKAIYNLFP